MKPTKKDELAALALEVLDAQHQVDQWQATVTSLTSKSTRFREMLAQAGTNCSSAFNDKNLADQLAQSGIALQNDSDLASAEITAAVEKTGALATQVKIVIDKLISSAEVINKLANLVIRNKAVNPLIPDELLSLLTTADADATNAVALTLVALQSTFTARASAIGSGAAIALEQEQARVLYNLLTVGDTSVQTLIGRAYQNAKDRYAETNEACTEIAVQVDEATAKLSDAEVNLKSLQAALAAG